MERYDNLFDDIRNLVMELIYSEDSLQDFNTIIEIDKDLDRLKIRMEDIGNEYREVRKSNALIGQKNRDLEREITLLKEKMERYETES